GPLVGGGAAVDSGFAATLINGTYGGVFGFDATYDPTTANPAQPGPPLPGFDPSDVAFDANNKGSVSLGSNVNWSEPTMTVTAWFKVGNGFPGGSDGGDRVWTNNQNDASTSLQITLGGGANIVVGINPALGAGEGVTDPYSAGNFQIVDSSHTAGGTVAGTGVKDIKNSEWHHVVASRNGPDIDDVILVIDGVNYPPSSWSNSTDSWGTTSTDAQIATRTPGDGGGSLHVLNGLIDEVAIWLDRQLTVEEALTLYGAAVQSAVEGDSDGNGAVDGLDYLTWAANFGKKDLGVFESGGDPGYLTVHGAVNGDFNYDNVVDGLDYLRWASNYGISSSVVPEPGSLVLAALALLGLAAVRRR
ncbi:MAG: PEP-CTERM sorting domain-containing protein, partial [Planctomycetales bacterium]|nr:PEP-CTERM sorting domain-containing protein [Planctomycetales bacterium]